MHAIYSNPIAVLDFLERLDGQQRTNIKEIFYLIDYHSFNGPANYDPVDYEDLLQRFFYKVKRFSALQIIISWHKVINNIYGSGSIFVHPDGYTIRTKEEHFKGNIAGMYHSQEFQTRTIRLLGEVDQYAKKHNIRITYFTAPFHPVILNRLELSKKIELTKNILREIDGYYEWNYMAHISPFDEKCIDLFHPRAATLKDLFDHYRTPEYFVTMNNFTQYLEHLIPTCKKFDLLRVC